MSKVLISFLGTSRPEKRLYREATYRFGDGAEFKTPFIAKALAEYYHVDKIILIGTVKSMWEEVYYVFANEHGCFDEAKYWELSSACTSANHDTPLSLPHVEDVESALGRDSKVVLIKYGLNQKEIEFNATKILSIERFLKDHDQLIVDITHSFRSLPMMLMNVLIYLQNVSKKHLNIEHITYGMLDVTSEMDEITPVVELKSILDMSNWISAAYAFSQFGNAYKISELLKSEDRDAAQRLKRFSDILNLNHISSIMTEVQNLSAIKNRKYGSLIPEMILNPIIKDFISNFGTAKTLPAFQYKLAEWQYRHNNYCAAYLTLQEAIVSYVCESSGLKSDDYVARESAKKSLSEDSSELGRIYRQVRKTRNALAHSLENGQNYVQMINNLRENISKLKNIIK